MANVKISELPAAAALDGSELLESVQSAANVQTTTGAVAALAASSLPWYADIRRSIRIAQADGDYDFNTGAWSGGTIQSINLTTINSLSHPAQGTSSLADSMIKSRWTSAASTNAGCGGVCNNTKAGVYRTVSAGPAGFGGGFDFFARVSFFTARSDQRAFVGLHPSSSGPTATIDPSAYLNMVGLAKDEGDTNVKVMHNDGSGTATEVDLGITFVSLLGKVVEVYFHGAPDGSSIDYDIYVVDDDTHYTGNLSTNLPADATAMWPLIYVNTGASTSTAVDIDMNRLVIATDL
jgi:hypothetical protein